MAIKKIYDLSVDLKRTSVRDNVPVLVQGDSAEFRIRLLDNGAELSTVQLSGITSVKMQSGYDAQTVIQTVGTLQGSVAVFRLKKNELFRSGTVQAMVQLEDTEDRISTLRFQYQVIPDLSGNYIPGEQDITVFQRYMNDAQAKIDEMAATDVAQLTVKLAETVKKDEAGSISWAMADQNFREIALGEKPMPIVGVDSVGSPNIIPKSVTREKTDFIIPSTNLLNADDFTLGFNLNNSTGLPEANESFAVSGFMPTEGNQPEITHQILKICFYDINKNYISYTGSISYTTPTNARFRRVVCYPVRLKEAQINKGAVVLPYEKYGNKVSHLLLQNRSIPASATNFIEAGSTNLINKNTVITGKSFDNATGLLVDNPNVGITDFEPMKPNTDFIFENLLKVAFYDENNRYISFFEGVSKKFKSPSNTSSYRAVSFIARYDIMQMNEGDTLLPFEEYSVKVKGIPLVRKVDETYSSFSMKDLYTIIGKTDETYSAPVIPSFTDIESTTHEVIFNLYDELVSDFPSFVKKSVWGTGEEGSTLYRYDLNAEPIPDNNVKTAKPKMILVSAVHGSERAGVYALYQAMKQICEKWQEDESLETLRWNVHFIVIPIVCAYGYDNNARKNSNGVDIARNLPEGWTYNSNPSSDQYAGEAPLSESEAVLLDKLLKDNKDDTIYFTSFHNFTASSDLFIWNAGATNLQINLGKQLVSKMSRKWKKEYDWLAQDESTYLGYADSNAPLGSEGRQAVAYGIQGSTFEINNRFTREPGHEKYSSTVFTLGVETFINWLLMNLKYNVEFYNKRR